MAEYFELCKSVGKKGAYRVIRNARTKAEIQQFIKENPDENLYFSVYEFSELNNGIPFYESAICNKLFIEFDSPNHGVIANETWRDLRKLLDWCSEEEKLSGKTIRPQIYFSGGSGYHVLFNLSTPLKELRDNKVLQKVGEKLKYLTQCEYIDLAANKGFSQLRRIPNTVNQKTGYYCIPLTLDEAYNLPPDAIIALAQKPRRIDNNNGDSTYFEDAIKVIAKAMAEKTYEHPAHTKYKNAKEYIEGQSLGRIRPCLFRLMQRNRLSFDERTWLATEMIRCGWDDERIHGFFIKMEKYDHKITQEHLNKIRSKGLWAPSCRYLREKDYCRQEYHLRSGDKEV